MNKKITIQGIAGCYHEAAARSYFGEEEIETVPCSTFPEMFDRMNNDRSLLGIIAIENTIAGSILQNHELLRKSELSIIGEYKLRISHVLAALPGETMDDILEVNSHPMALMQCGDFLQAHPKMKVVEKDDTAGSAQEISHRHLSGHAEGIETNKRNFTRFLILADPFHREILIAGKRINKASLVFSLPHTQGSLSKVLTILSFYDINLSKIQSMPIIGKEWEYRFYIDLTFDNFTRYKQSLEAIRPLTKDFKILGEYAEFNQPL